MTSSSTTSSALPPAAAPSTSLWSGQFVLALSLAIVFAIGFNGLVPLLPLYLASFQASDQEIGLVVGSFGIAALVFRPLSGQLTDRFGPRRITLFGALMFAVTTPLMALTSAVPLLLVLRLLQATGLVCFWTASTALGMSTAQPHRMGVAMGFLGMTGPIGGLISAPFAVPLAEALGWQGTFILMGGLAILAACMLGAVKPRPRPHRDAALAPRRSRIPVSRTALTPALFFLSWTLTQGAILAFSPLLALDRNLGNPGLFLAVLNFGNTIVRPGIGLAVDRWGRPVIILPGLLLSALAIAMIGVAQSDWWFMGWGFVYGAANGMIYTSLISLAIDRTPVAERGGAIATFQWGWDMGSSASAFLLGTLTGWLGYGGIFVLSALCPLTGSGLFTWAWRSGRLHIPARSPAAE